MSLVKMFANEDGYELWVEEKLKTGAGPENCLVLLKGENLEPSQIIFANRFRFQAMSCIDKNGKLHLAIGLPESLESLCIFTDGIGEY